MAFAGLRGTNNWGTDERPKDFHEGILRASPNGNAPMTALMARMSEKKTTDPEFAWFEEKQTPVRVQVAADLSAASTAATLASGGFELRPGDLLLVEGDTEAYTNEIVGVSAVTTDTAVTLVRARSGSTAAGIPNTTWLTRIGTAFQEGSGAPTPSTRNPTKLFNYTQIFKKSIGITATADATTARTGDPWKNDRDRKAFDLAADMEEAIMWGKRSEDLTGTQPLRTFGGLRSFLTSNVKVWSADPTIDEFIDEIAPLFDYQADGTPAERIAFVGNGALMYLNRLVHSDEQTRMNFDGVISAWGMNFKRLILPMGELAIKSHPLMNVHPLYRNSMFVINPKGIIKRTLRPMKFMPDIQAPDEDARRAQWIGEWGIEVRHEYTMGYFGGIYDHA